uniref:Uncharacterized protein n=1 Tax=Arcella intermedia TaxID=1963864 RepID=A0A6B2L8Z9_9EUKA
MQPNNSEPLPGSAELKQILALDPLSISQRGDFVKHFESIANVLLNQYSLETGGLSHRIAEIEFYLCGTNHDDVFTHQDPMQQTSANWYFHKAGTNYKGGSYKGLDITFGKSGYGGILLRALSVVETGEYIEGSCNVVNHILGLNKVDGQVPEIEDFVKSGFDLDVTKVSSLYLKKTDFEERKMFSGPRVGLTLKKKDGDRLYYIMRPYRFLTFPQEVRKGRPNLVLGLYAQGMELKDIQKISGCTAAVVKKYCGLYDAGKDAPIDDFLGALKTDDLCKLCGLLNHLNKDK